MFKNVYEKNFEKWESKKRAKFGDKVFLEKYITKMENNSKLLKILLPLDVILFFVAATLWLVVYIKSNDTFDLVLSIVLAVCSAIWGLICYLFFSHHFKHREQKIEKWKEELKNLG